VGHSGLDPFAFLEVFHTGDELMAGHDPMAQRPDESNEQYWQHVLRDPRLRAILRALDEQMRTACERAEIARKVARRRGHGGRHGMSDHMRDNPEPLCGIHSAPICLCCARFHHDDEPGLRCDAFPDGEGIPYEIIHTQVDHRYEAVEGDHGLRFVPTSPEAAARAREIIADARAPLATTYIRLVKPNA
jgi:hypothetical protein